MSAGAAGIPGRFAGQFAGEALAHGAELIAQIDPTNISLSAIEDGACDSNTAAVGAFREAVSGINLVRSAT
jgi:hypothetical protein